MKNIKKFKYPFPKTEAGNSDFKFDKTIRAYTNPATGQCYEWIDTYGCYRELTDEYVDSLKATA